MKQTNRLGKVALKMSLITMTVLGTLSVSATTQVGVTCPQKFIATVTNIEDVQARKQHSDLYVTFKFLFEGVILFTRMQSVPFLMWIKAKPFEDSSCPEKKMIPVTTDILSSDILSSDISALSMI